MIDSWYLWLGGIALVFVLFSIIFVNVFAYEFYFGHTESTLNKFSKRIYKFGEFVEDSFNFEGPESIYSVIVIIATLLLVIVTLCYAIIIPSVYSDEKGIIKNNSKTVQEFHSLTNPTALDCKRAEEYNERIKDFDFVKKEVVENLEKVDSELLWAKFEKNVGLKLKDLQ